jgi:hypothetical protein
MHVLQIEHPVRDFEIWKAAFDRFSSKRQQSGVRRHQLLRPTDDSNYVVIELGFDSPSEAPAWTFRRRLWWSGCSSCAGRRSASDQPRCSKRISG